ncbi:MAG TPA: acetate kinase, partial [Lapillicoccus sp.]|nr:acetate kinase [Lapillicoccus sp.]
MNSSSARQPVLVVNAGSSSLKYQLVEVASGTAMAKGSVERIGERSSKATHETGDRRHTVDRPIASHGEALAVVAGAFREYG